MRINEQCPILQTGPINPHDIYLWLVVRNVKRQGAILLECVPRQVAEEVSKALSIPVVGIGAGLGVDALVLVYHDILGYGVERVPKFVKQYHSVNTIILESIQAYTADSKNKRFPEEKHTFTMKEEELKVLYGGKLSR